MCSSKRARSLHIAVVTFADCFLIHIPAHAAAVRFVGRSVAQQVLGAIWQSMVRDVHVDARDHAAPSPLPPSENNGVQECERRVAVTWRLLLRCMWNCLLQQRSGLHNAAVHEQLRGSSTKHRAVVVENHHAYTSRNVYRTVLQQRQQARADHTANLERGRLARSGGAPPASAGGSSSVQCPVVFASSASFAVLRSSLPMMLALLFLRRLHHVACLVRPHQAQIGRRFVYIKSVRRAFRSWRSVTREAVRWRRWMLRRCVDHWSRYVHLRLTIRGVLTTFRCEVGRRACAVRSVRAERMRRCLAVWANRWRTRDVTRQLSTKCATFVMVKFASRAAFAVREDLTQIASETPVGVSCTSDDSGAVLRAAPSMDARGAACLYHRIERYCFCRWKQRTEERLDHHCAQSLRRLSVLRTCIGRWRHRLLVDAAFLPADNHTDVSAECTMRPCVVLTQRAVSPIELAYKLRGFLAMSLAIARASAFQRWRHKWRNRAADRLFLSRSLSRALVIWLHRTADARLRRQWKHQVIAVWRAKLYHRQRAAYAMELSRAMAIHKCFERWSHCAMIQRFHRRRQHAVAIQCLAAWRTQAALRAATAHVQRKVCHGIFHEWQRRAALQRMRTTQELVSEALWEHIAIKKVFRKWHTAHQQATEERAHAACLMAAIDNGYNEQLKKRVLTCWRCKATKKRNNSR